MTARPTTTTRWHWAGCWRAPGRRWRSRTSVTRGSSTRAARSWPSTMPSAGSSRASRGWAIRRSPTHVVFSGSTGEGLEQLAEAEHASVIVFGSDYRTPPGRAEPGTSAQGLLEGASVAIAVAAAGLRTREDAGIATIAVSAPDGDGAAQQTADALAGQLGAKLVRARRPGNRPDRGRLTAERVVASDHAERLDSDDAQRREGLGPSAPLGRAGDAVARSRPGGARREG